MKQAAEETRKYFEGINIIISPYHDAALPSDIYQMSDLVEAQEEELPAIWFLHGHAQEKRRWDRDLDEQNFSKEALILWGRRAGLLIERPEMIALIDKLKKDPDADPEEVAYFD